MFCFKIQKPHPALLLPSSDRGPPHVVDAVAQLLFPMFYERLVCLFLLLQQCACLLVSCIDSSHFFSPKVYTNEPMQPLANR